MSQYDTDSLYQFLTSTPEKGLRSILLDKQFTESHLNILLKVVRNCNQEQFEQMFSMGFPKVKFNDKENLIKPKFWQECEACLNARGLLSPAQAKKIEKIAA
jgi:hypothetical protein